MLPPPELPLYQIVYLSTANQPFSCDELGQLLLRARSYNEQHQLTGVLLYNDNEFLQVLEGRRPELDHVFERIANDPRHGRLRVLANGPLERPVFPDWRMGFVGECADFFGEIQEHIYQSNANLLSTVAPGAVPALLALLADFAQGPYADSMPV